jgi:MFS family permease
LSYKELFLTHKIVKQISLLQFIAYFGAWFTNVAIFSMLVNFGASAFIISLVAAMHFIPAIIISPFSGPFVDRVNLKKLMLILLSVEFSMTLCFSMINSLNDVWLLLIFLFIRMGSASIFFTVEMTLMPKLLSGVALVKANEIHSMIWSFTFTVGMALGGVVVDNFGVKTSFLIDSAFFATAIIILLFIKIDIEPQKIKISILNSIKDGVEYLKQNKHLFHFIFLHASVGFLAFDSLITLLADYEYKYVISVPLAIGFTHFSKSFALMIGPLFISSWVDKQRLFYLFIIQGITIIIWAVTQHNFYFGLFTIFFVGFTSTTLWSYTYAMLQEQIDDKYLGRVLAYNEMVFMTTTVITTFFIGIMANFIPLMIITIILGVMFFGVGYYYKMLKLT